MRPAEKPPADKGLSKKVRRPAVGGQEGRPGSTRAHTPCFSRRMDSGISMHLVAMFEHTGHDSPLPNVTGSEIIRTRRGPDSRREFRSEHPSLVKAFSARCPGAGDRLAKGCGPSWPATQGVNWRGTRSHPDSSITWYHFARPMDYFAPTSICVKHYCVGGLGQLQRTYATVAPLSCMPAWPCADSLYARGA